MLGASHASAQEPSAGSAAPGTEPVSVEAPPPVDTKTSEPANQGSPPHETARGAAHVDEDRHAAPTDDDEPDAAHDTGGKHDRKKREKGGKHDLRFKGRVFALAELSHRRERVLTVEEGVVERDIRALELRLQSARIGVDYRAPLRWLSAELEIEIAGKVEAKDAVIKAGDTFFVKAGRFKVPTAALEVASPWTLPQVRRGLVHNLLVDWMDVGGRAPGVAFGYHGRSSLEPRLTLGVFQGSTLDAVLPGDRDVRLLDRASLRDQTYAARAEASPFGVTFGAWYQHRINSVAAGKAPHFSTFGVDATIDRRVGSGGVRAWVDGGGGRSPYLTADKPGDGDAAWFAFGRAQLAYRFGGVAQGDPYLEPFGFFAIMDPDTEVVSDMVTEGAVGLSAGFWDRARLTLQGELTNGQRNFPAGFLGGATPEHASLLLQAGARF